MLVRLLVIPSVGAKHRSRGTDERPHLRAVATSLAAFVFLTGCGIGERAIGAGCTRKVVRAAKTVNGAISIELDNGVTYDGTEQLKTYSNGLLRRFVAGDEAVLCPADAGGAYSIPRGAYSIGHIEAGSVDDAVVRPHK